MKSKNRFLENILEKSLKASSKIFLPESDDLRVKKAINILSSLGFKMIDFEEISSKRDAYFKLISRKKFTNNWSIDMKNNFLDSPLNLGIVALENDDIDSLIAGASHSTSEVLRSSIRIVGINKEARWVSSVFFMLSSNNKLAFTFADCGVIPDPNSEQLCSIAYESSKFHKFLTGEEPKVAFLSFSTKGSAEHYKIKKVQNAVRIFKKKYPHIIHDGEVQFDVAINKGISDRKIGNSLLDGDANVFIFPDLDSANISYKITQHLGNFTALGPLLQGLNKTVHDLSRGCSIEDIVYVTAIAALQANEI
tara:strand:- start:865 stop:1788 length:924 start_codon:yes stop_codon:yes gene_type:complete